MRKYNGFSLAEVLITLALIGVVAGMTLPIINSSNVVMKKQVVTALAKAFNTLEMANSNLLQMTDSTNMFDACNDNSTYTLNNFDIGLYFSCLNNKNILKTTLVTSTGSSPCFAMKDGIQFCQGIDPSNNTLLKATLNKTSNLASNVYYGYYYNITVDTNGSKGPNELAKDRFTIFVDLGGSVIAPGSYEFNDYNWASDSKDKPSAVLWENGCKGNTVSAKNFCTGSIVDNGWQIKYKY